MDDQSRQVGLRERARAFAAQLDRRRRFYVAVYRDPRTPWIARIVLWLTLVYAFSPIDLIPDFIPVVGYLDDLLVVPLGIWLAFRLVPKSVYLAHESKLRPSGD